MEDIIDGEEYWACGYCGHEETRAMGSQRNSRAKRMDPAIQQSIMAGNFYRLV